MSWAYYETGRLQKSQIIGTASYPARGALRFNHGDLGAPGGGALVVTPGGILVLTPGGKLVVTPDGRLVLTPGAGFGLLLTPEGIVAVLYELVVPDGGGEACKENQSPPIARTVAITPPRTFFDGFINNYRPDTDLSNRNNRNAFAPSTGIKKSFQTKKYRRETGEPFLTTVNFWSLIAD